MFLQGLLGLAVMVGLAWAMSENRRRIPVKTLAVGVAAQFALAALLLKVAAFEQLFQWLNDAVVALERATMAGTGFVFGYLGGGPLPFEAAEPGSVFVLAFRALPLVLVVSALSSLLFYWRVLPLVVRGFAWVLQRTMDVGGPVGVGAAANIFVGMVEAPLLVRPYLKALTRSELFTVMTCGMATIAGTVLALYATILADVIPGAVGHLLTASIISAPAAIVVARLMVPETGAATAGEVVITTEAAGSIDAIVRGANDGVRLLINIVAMLVVLVALVALVNEALGALPAIAGEPITLQRLFGYVLAPLAWLMGIPWSEAQTAGALLGTKTVLNELLAYLDLAALPEAALSAHSRLIMTYALCGFANLGSLGIMIGGLATVAPERRDEIVALGLKSIVAGTLATSMTGAVVGVL